MDIFSTLVGLVISTANNAVGPALGNNSHRGILVNPALLPPVLPSLGNTNGGITELPEVEMDTIELITFYGYPVEVYSVTTPDGYILELHRIPFGHPGNSLNSTEGKARPVIFLQHGLLGSSADWVTNLPLQSAGFVFADAGFDVWMGNVRGNRYSTGHRTLNRNDERYWQFSWDEMAEFDLPTMINGVLKATGQSSLYYVGHSQGTTMMFSRLSTEPTFARKIRKFFALAPVSTVGNIRGLFGLLGSLFGDHYIVSLHHLSMFASNICKLMIAKMLFGRGEFLPYSWLINAFAEHICGASIVNPLCSNILFQIGGPESAQLNATRVPVYLGHVPAGTSTQNVVHWAQMTRSKNMQKFNFGSSSANEAHYGQPTPPLYDLRRVNAPTYLFYSDSDWLADPVDVKRLLDVFPVEYQKMVVQLPQFNHLDFIWGERASNEIYRKILTIIGSS